MAAQDFEVRVFRAWAVAYALLVPGLALLTTWLFSRLPHWRGKYDDRLWLKQLILLMTAFLLVASIQTLGMTGDPNLPPDTWDGTRGPPIHLVIGVRAASGVWAIFEASFALALLAIMFLRTRISWLNQPPTK